MVSFSGEMTLKRLADTDWDREERLKVYALTSNAIADTPLAGTGYGSFRQIFRLYQDPSVRKIYGKAHNTYLENALELGLPGLIFLLAAIAALFWRCVLGLRERERDHIYPALGVAATALVAAHSLVDFSLQMPAVALTYAIIMGIAVAQSWSSRSTL